jgi:hypothetical protein
MRNDEHFSRDGKTGRVQVGSFDDDNEMQIKLELHDIGILTRGAGLFLAKTVTIAWRRHWRKDFPVHTPRPARAERRGAAPDFNKAELE